MELMIGDDWKIKTDDECWIVLRRKSKDHRMSNPDSPDGWESLAYCNDARDAFNSLLRHRVRRIELRDFEQIVKKIEEIREEIRTVMRRLDLM